MNAHQEADLHLHLHLAPMDPILRLKQGWSNFFIKNLSDKPVRVLYSPDNKRPPVFNNCKSNASKYYYGGQLSKVSSPPSDTPSDCIYVDLINPLIAMDFESPASEAEDSSELEGQATCAALVAPYAAPLAIPCPEGKPLYVWVQRFGFDGAQRESEGLAHVQSGTMVQPGQEVTIV